MPYYHQPGQTFTPVLLGAPAGIQAALGLRLIDAATGTAVTTIAAGAGSGVVEINPPSGNYRRPGVAVPTVGGTYLIQWDHGATEIVDTEQLVVSSTATPVVVPANVYFSVAEARTFKPLEDTAKYSDAAIEAARTGAEESIEHVCGVAFVPRTATEVLDGSGPHLLLGWPKVRSVTTASVNGTALTAAQLAEIKITPGGLYWDAGWASGVENVSVSYTHGFAVPPYRIKRAAILLTKDNLVDSPFGDRVLRIETETEALSRSWRGFGLPEVDEAVKQYDYSLPFA